MLETIARLLPFMVLGLIGLFVVVLLNEVSKQQKKTTRKFPASSSIQSILVELVKFTVAGILIYGVLKLNLSSYEVMFIMFMLAALFGASQEPTQQQKQQYQRIPVVPPKKVQSSSKKHTSSSSSSTKRTLHESHPIRIKLLAMVGGDIRTADRLLQQCQKNNPGMETEWYFSKVIADLIRDRR